MNYTNTMGDGDMEIKPILNNDELIDAIRLKKIQRVHLLGQRASFIRKMKEVNDKIKSLEDKIEALANLPAKIGGSK